MGKRKSGNSKCKTNTEKDTASNQGCKSLSSTLAGEGVKTSSDFAAVMSTLIGDVLGGQVSAQTANAACNAAGKLLKVVEMQHKYAPLTKNGVLRLTA